MSTSRYLCVLFFAACGHKALVDLRGGRLSCVGGVRVRSERSSMFGWPGWGRYELPRPVGNARGCEEGGPRRNRGGELVAAFRPGRRNEEAKRGKRQVRGVRHREAAGKVLHSLRPGALFGELGLVSARL